MNQGDSFKEIAGIIGGIGPEATNYFTMLLTKMRLPYAAKDQDHIPYLLFNNPQIPDRTEFILKNNSTDPIPELIRTGIALKNAGATFLVMTCNTAHAFAKVVEEGVGLPFVNMVDETTSYVQRIHGDMATIGLLATNGTIQSQIYQQAFEKVSKNIKVLIPQEAEQNKIHQAIYDIKSNSVNDGNTQILFEAANGLAKRGASVIILGCTEIPLALSTKKGKYFSVDPMEILAQKVIKRTILSKTEEKSEQFLIQTSAR